MDHPRAPALRSLVSAIAADAKYACRFLSRHPGFTAVATGTLALGLGMSTAAFSAEYAIALRPFPFPKADRIVRLEPFDTTEPAARVPSVNALFANEVLAAPRLFRSVGAALPITAVTHAPSGPEVVNGEWVSGGFFATYGIEPILGRAITDSDTKAGAARVVVLSHALSQRLFGGATNAVGRVVDLTVSPTFIFTPFAQSSQPYAVVGVMPPLDRFPIDDALWVPLEQWNADPRMKGMGGAPHLTGNVTVTARLRDDGDISRSRADLRSLLATWRRENPGSADTWQIDVSSLRDASRPHYAEVVVLLATAVNAVLLLACVSLGGLLGARTRARHREMAIREALGANRHRLVQQVLVESSLLAIAGGALGLAIAVGAQRLARTLAPPAMSQLRSMSLEGPVLLYACLICGVGGVVVGALPAIGLWRARRVTAIRLAEGSGSVAGGGGRSRGWLIAAQIALVFPLVMVAMLAVRSLERLVNVNLGYDRDHVLVMSVKLSASACAPRRFDACLEAIRAIVERTRAIPGVTAAAVSNTRPFEIPMSSQIVPDSGGDAVAQARWAQFVSVTPDYFRAMTIPMRDGRMFSERDGPDAPAVAIVNETFARQLLGGRAIGRKIRFEFGRDSWMEIVGEVGDANDRRLDAEPMPAFYVPLGQARFVAWTTLLVRTTGAPSGIATSARAAVAAVDPAAPASNISTLDQDITLSAAQPRFNTLLLSTFASFGLVVALLGIYGLVAYSVGERLREFGVRRAVGASSFDLTRLIVGEGVWTVGGGLTIGIGLAIAAGRWYQSQLFEITPTDPSTLTGVAVLIVGVAAIAYGLPARRATQVDPVVVLRNE